MPTTTTILANSVLQLINTDFILRNPRSVIKLQDLKEEVRGSFDSFHQRLGYKKLGDTFYLQSVDRFNSTRDSLYIALKTLAPCEEEKVNTYFIWGLHSSIGEDDLRNFGHAYGTLANSGVQEVNGRRFAFLQFIGPTIDFERSAYSMGFKCTTHTDIFSNILNTDVTMAPQTESRVTDNDFLLLSRVESRVIEEKPRMTKQLIPYAKRASETIIRLLLKWNRKLKNMGLIELLPLRKLIKGGIYFMNAVGPAFEIFDLIVGINNLFSAKRITSQMKESLQQFSSLWYKLSDRIRVVEFISMMGNSGVDNLFNKAYDCMVLQAKECQKFGKQLLASIAQDISRLQKIKESRAGFTLEFLIDIICGFLAPSPLVIISVIRFLTEYETDYEITWQIDCTKRIKQAVADLNVITEHGFLNEPGDVNHLFQNNSTLYLSKMSTNLLNLMQKGSPTFPVLKRKYHLYSIISDMQDKILNIILTGTKAATLCYNSVCSFIKDFKKNPRMYMRRGKEFLGEQWKKACVLVRGILSFRIDMTASVSEKLSALIELTHSIVKSGWKTLIDLLTIFVKDVKQNMYYFSDKTKRILQAIWNWFKKWKDKDLKPMV